VACVLFSVETVHLLNHL